MRVLIGSVSRDRQVVGQGHPIRQVRYSLVKDTSSFCKWKKKGTLRIPILGAYTGCVGGIYLSLGRDVIGGGQWEHMRQQDP